MQATRLAQISLLFLGLGVGCAPAPAAPSASIRALGAGEQWLRSIPPTGICAGGGAVVEIRLHGSPSDWRLAWLTLPDGSTRQLSWLAGTSARFTPDLEVIGPDGWVVAREGSLITGTCTVAPDFLMAEFRT
jgi:hypothetical protein